MLARVAGATAVSLVGQVAVDMPQGFYGSSDEMTTPGLMLAVAWLALAFWLVVSLRRKFHATLPWALVFLAVGAGLFVPAITSDPLIAGAVALWHLTLVALLSFPSQSKVGGHRSHHPGRSQAGSSNAGKPHPEHSEQPRDDLDHWRRDTAPAQRHLAALAVVLTVAVVGYGLSGHLAAAMVCAALHLAALVLAMPLLRSLVSTGSRAPWVVALPTLSALLAIFTAGIDSALALLVLTQLVLLLVAVRDADLLHELVQVFFRHPSGLLALSFVAIILVGTLLLTFPAASATGVPIAPLDALFTATSATCVTGLIVLDTPHAFSPLGHGVLLALIQVGGLGIMVLSTYAMLLLGGNLGLRGEHALSQLLESHSSTAAYGLTRFIVLSTLAVETVGAILLGLIFWRQGSGPGEAAWLGVFHSVSAFCNAGFALFSDSLVGFQDHPQLLGVVSALIVLGGIGFVVLYALWLNLWRLTPWKPGRSGTGLRSLSVQVKAVMLASLVLVLGGWALYAGLEWQHSLDGLSFADKASNALFQSITLRTAGFNSVDYSTLSPATTLLMMVLMFIGASPGSTGGGIKTATLVVLLAATVAIARGPGVVRLFDREVPRATVFRALAILMASVAIVLATFFLLLVFERLPFETLLFEAVSAVGTVGLSLGATGELGAMGKVVIIVAMFIGRIGPLTLALVLGTGAEEAKVRHARARIMVG